MAARTTVSGGLTFTSGEGDTFRATVSFAVTPSGGNALENIQDIGTSAEAITMGDVAPGFVLFKNLDSTNYVQIGADNTAITPVIFKLSPGEGVVVPTTNGTWYAKANSAPVRLLVLAVDA